MDAERAILVFLATLLIAATAGLYWWHGSGASAAAAAAYKTPQESDNVYVRFDMEAYDDIESQYWQQVSDSDLSNVFQQSLAKAAQNDNVSAAPSLATSTRSGVAQMVSAEFEGLSITSEEKLAIGTIEVALYNLAPTGRSNLLSSAAQQELENTVNNVQPNSNLYSELGLSNDASEAQIRQAVAERMAELSATTTASGKAALAQVETASATLSNPTNKAIYDQTGAEATVFSHELNSHTLYIDISSVAPSTITEFAAAVDAASTSPSVDSLIIDLRGNIGGDLSFAQEFLALFFGPDEYAFDLFHQGNLEVQRTANIAVDKTLAQFKEIAVLTDSMTQSTAELSASALKHDHLAYTIGTTTRVWGSVEAIIPLKTSIDPSQTYALELVEYLTVRYDNMAIEGNGVVPDVDVSTTNWSALVPKYFASPYMVSAIESAIRQAPQR